jgi:hypothetical protein
MKKQIVLLCGATDFIARNIVEFYSVSPNMMSSVYIILNADIHT